MASLALFVAACSDDIEPVLEVHQGALTVPPNSQYLFVPAYFPSGIDGQNADVTYDWPAIGWYNDPDPDTGSQTVFYAIVNKNSGPGTAKDDVLQQKITQYMTNQMIQVFGYVNYKMGVLTFDQVKADVMAWKNMYTGLTGIFFDVANRPDSSALEVGRAEYLAQLVHDNFRDRYGQHGSVFNWGGSYMQMEPYVNCVGSTGQGGGRNTQTWFVTEEMTQSKYMNQVPNDLVNSTDANYTWIRNYNPMRFVNLIHGVTSNQVSALLDKSRRLNAFNVYLTDRIDPMDSLENGLPDPGAGYPSRPWNPLAGFNVGGTTIWNLENRGVTQGTFAYPGSDDPPPRSSCPMQSSS